MNNPPQAIATAEQLVHLSRPQNILYPGLLAALSCYLAGDSGVRTAVYCYLFIAVLYTIAVVYNNHIDRRTDRMNRRQDNPLAHGKLSTNTVWLFLIANILLLGFLQTGLEQPASFIIGLAYLCLAFAYSNRIINIQSRGWWAPLLLAACYGSLPLLLGLSQLDELEATNLVVLGLLAMQILLIFPVVLAKDYKDLSGDRATNKRTPLVRYGATIVQNTARLAAIFAVVACIALVEQLSLSFVSLLAVYVLFVFYIHQMKRTPHWAIQKAGMVCTLAISLLLLESVV